MLFDIDTAMDWLSEDRDPPSTWPAGAPAIDFVRSPAAARIGRLAADAGLFLFHFEKRAHLPMPPEFLPDGVAPELAEPPEWQDGVLPEAKYASFRHDLLIGSFHPGHRGKWTTHELCHALVGFGWRPGATPLFHATAGRLAELLPVVLYYFLDEVRLQRCPDHAGGGPLYRAFCPACEAVAGARPADVDDRQVLRDASRYLDRELAAVARTMRLGRPIGWRWGSLDLCTDGLAYAAAHGPRLGSEAFARYAEAFLDPTGGYWPTLDALCDRVEAVCRALVEGAQLAPMADGPEAGRWRWVTQDLGWRMIESSLSLDGERRREADEAIGLLAMSTPGEDAVRAARDRWPGPAEVFEVGYPLLDGGLDLAGVAEGLSTVCPLTLELFEDAGLDPVPAFATEEPAARRPLGDRFAAWLGGDVAILARFEAALRHAGADGLVGVLGAGEGARLGAGVRHLVEEVDPIGLAEQVEAGEIAGEAVDGVLALRGELPREPTELWVVRDGAGEIAVLDSPLDQYGASTYDRWEL